MVHKFIAFLALLFIVLVSAACTTSRLTARQPTPPGATATATATGTPTGPTFSHVYIIVMENKGYSNIVGNADAPYINSLIADYGLATSYHGVSHPSEPNYLALFSGSTQGIADDAKHDFTGENLADQLEAHGKTWQVFEQNVPLDCFTGMAANGGEDGPGQYARKHNPAISFTNISTAPERCSHITDFTHFDPETAYFEFIVPNQCNDMHDCSVATGDAFLQSFVPKILNSDAWQQGGALFIVWDEDTPYQNNHVPTLIISKAVLPGFRSNVTHTHYSLLRTIEDAWGLGCLNQTCDATRLNEFFTGQQSLLPQIQNESAEK